MAAEEIGQLLGLFQGAMTQVETVQTVRQWAAAYDTCAVTAMRELISKFELTFAKGDVQDLASTAWKIADAMMAERVKRGLGGFTEE